MAGLARELKKLGWQVLVAAPQDGEGERTYVHDGIEVYRYPARASAEPLLNWLRQQRPAVAHFHSLTGGLGYRHWRAVQQAGFPVYLTFHMPTAFCCRGSMLRWGQRPCDGEVRPWRCTACYIHSRLCAGDSVADSAHSSGVLLGGGACPAQPGANAISRLKTLIGLPAALRQRRAQLQEMFSRSRRVVAVCEWIRKALLDNGCSAEKLVLSRQGVTEGFADTGAEKTDAGIPRLGYLGRLDWGKGDGLLAEAVRSLPSDCRMQVELRGIPGDAPHLQQLEKLVQGDGRLRLLPPLPTAEVGTWLRSLDALVVPSRVMETGPLVIYEAWAAGLPVIGAGHGGIAELVQEGVNGLLFVPGSVSSLAKILRQVCADPSRLASLRKGIGPVRDMREVAEEMDEIYRRVGIDVP